jgi:hypothetical protein
MSHVRPNKSELALPTEASEVTSWHWRVGMSVDTGQRNALLGFSSVALGVAALAAGPAKAEAGSSVVPQGAGAA